MSAATQPEQVPGKFCDALETAILDWTEITPLI